MSLDSRNAVEMLFEHLERAKKAYKNDPRQGLRLMIELDRMLDDFFSSQNIDPENYNEQ